MGRAERRRAQKCEQKAKTATSVTEYPVFTLRIGGFPYRGTSCIEG